MNMCERVKMKKKPRNELRYDEISHFPEVDKKRNASRCKDCKGSTHFFCSKCNVHLCLNSNRNCFEDFHILKLAKYDK